MILIPISNIGEPNMITKLLTTTRKQTKPANSPINSKLTKLMREKVSRDERSRELQKKENPCKIQSKQKKKA